MSICVWIVSQLFTQSRKQDKWIALTNQLVAKKCSHYFGPEGVPDIVTGDGELWSRSINNRSMLE